MNDEILRIRNFSDAIAALPAMLSYVPTDSFAAILCTNDDHGLMVQKVMRGDIIDDPTAARRLPSTIRPALIEADTVLLIAICGEDRDSAARATLDGIRDGLAHEGVDVVARILARDVTKAGAWTNIDTGATGPVYPYTDSIITAELIRRGRNITPSRDQLLAEFNATTNPAPVIAANPADILMDTLEEVAAAISTALPDKDNTLATRVGILITSGPDLRDTLLLLGLEDTKSAATVWTRLANQLSGEARAQALTIAGANYYMSRDGVRARVALDLAMTEAESSEAPVPRLAGILDAMLDAGIPPEEVQGVLARIISRGD